MGKILNSSNTSSEKFVEMAHNTFVKNEKLIINVNRGICNSSVYSPDTDRLKNTIFCISKNVINECLYSLSPKQGDEEFFFKDLNGDLCYVDQNIVDLFTEFTSKKFPDLKFKRDFALVDEKTDIELMSAHIAKGFMEEDNIPIKIKIKAWIAQLLPDKE